VKRPLLAWGAVIVPLWIAMILCTHWEPVLRDGWGHVYWHLDHRVTFGSMWEVLREGWLGSNPRFGQMLTYPLYAPGPWHSIITPIVELGLFYTLATLALGRWPSLRRADDALVYATVFAIAAICTPEFGSMLFYRPYIGNYLFGLALNALWLVPYRLHFERARTPRWWWAPALFVLGLAAGNCNEHTGPAVLIVAAIAVWLIVRRGDRARVWMIAGMVGMLAGYLLLIFAPGQHERYNHLAEAQRTVDLIADRGVRGNLRILLEPVAYLAQALPWIVIARLYRGEPMSSNRRRGALGALLVGALAVGVLLGSPKLGTRLYLATTCFGAVAIASWVVLSPARRALGVLAGVVIAFVCIRCVMIYAPLTDEAQDRVAAMTRAKAGDKLVFHRYPDGTKWFDRDLLGHRRWFLGDDFANAAQRDSLAGNWHVEIQLVDP
jgi:hypothetical protein